MAKSAFAKRFPYARLFVLLAILIALPLVLWSVQKAPTQTQEHAAARTCGPNGQNPSCPTGYACGNWTAGNPNFGGTCSLGAPTGLSASAKCHYYASSPNAVYFSFHWNSLPFVTKYNIYVLITDKKGNYAQSFTFYPGTNTYHPAGVSLFHNVLAKWRIRAYDPAAGIYSPYSGYQSIALGC